MATSEDHIEKRIYIGGLHSSVNDQLLRDRFSRYGTIGDINIAKDVEGHCRGFGHFNINTTPKQWASCMSIYNGAKWKGQVMRLEDAKMDYMERKRKEDKEQQIKEEKQQKKRQRIQLANQTVMESKDMKLVTDKIARAKRGWRQGRYGRGIAYMRLKKPDGSELVFDPKLYPNNLMKLYDDDVKMKPVSRLPMYYEEAVAYDNNKEDHVTSISRNDTRYEDESSTMNKDNEKRLAAMERRIKEEKQRQEILQQSLKSIDNEERFNHVTFETSDDEGKDKQLEPEVSNTTERPAPKDSSWMFDSDSEDDSNNFEIKINPALEGEKGRELLELQSKFKGDERFKLSEEFKEEEDEDDTQKQNTRKKVSEDDNEPEDDISKSIIEEKNQSMELLRAMFGEEKVEKTKPKETQWNIGARYDPDAEDADEFLRKPIEEESDESDHVHNDNDDNDEAPLPGNTEPVTAMPVVSTEKHFEVNVNMKPLFGGQEAEPFKLFGDDEDTGADDDNGQPLFGNMLGINDHFDETEVSSFTPKQNKESHVGLGVLFFFHAGDPSLMKKSCFGYDSKGSFQRTEGEDYETTWKEKRPEIGEILKKRQKQAVRRHKKLQTQGVK
ncbi:hypothetical protein BDC45DRAFT_547399 [Circinella umbellata]|nr:hypothetical protein BDC45DRAFT_547399 [Circinella umbellata]